VELRTSSDRVWQQEKDEFKVGQVSKKKEKKGSEKSEKFGARRETVSASQLDKTGAG